MRPLKIELDNLFSIDHAELNLKHRGVLLIHGRSEDDGDSNGAGKSSLSTTGICWVIWGQLPSDQRVLAGDVVNRHTGRQKAWGRYYYQGVDSCFYMIHRQRNPNKLQLFIATAEAWSDISGRGDVQATINQTTGRDFATFIQTEFFGQARNMSFLGLGGGEQREILEAILPFGQFQSYADLATTRATFLAAEVRAVQNAKHNLEGQLQQLTTQQFSLAKKSSNFDVEQKIKEEGLQAQLIGAPDERKTGPALAEAKIALDAVRQRRAEKAAVHNAARVSAGPAPAAPPETCEECGREFEDLGTRETAFIRAKKLYAQLVDTAERTLRELHELEESERAAYQEARRMEEEHHLASSAQRLRQQLEVLHGQENPYLPMLKQAEVSLAAEKDKYSRLEAEERRMEKSRGHFEFWRKAFSKDMRLIMLSAVCQYLNERTAHHLQGLNNSQISVEFRTEKKLVSGETRGELVVSAQSRTGSSTFSLLSGGEKQLVGFAVGLALSDLARLKSATASQLLIMDEPFVQLGPRNSECVVNYLHTLAKERETILLVSNEPSLIGLVPNSVQIVKSGGISRVT